MLKGLFGPLVAALLVLSDGALRAELREPEVLAKSPSGKMSCVLERRKEGGGLVYVLIGANKKIEVFNTGRYVNVEWSPGDEHFAIINHPDSHSASISVFSVAPVVIDGKDDFKVELLYQTPSPTRMDAYWSIEKWDLGKMAIDLKCRYSTSGEAEHPVWKNTRWEIPIDYFDEIQDQPKNGK